MRIGIDMGHSLSGAGTGAVSIVKEVDINRQVGKRLIDMLQEKGHTVVNCTVDYANTVNDQLGGIARKANAQTLDVFCSLHGNAGGGQGTEVYIWNGSWSGKENNRAIAKKIVDNVVSSTGYKNRGVKEADFYVLQATVAPAVLVEMFFIDTQSDVNNFNVEKMAKGLFKGLTGTDYVSKPVTPPTGDHEVVIKGPYTEVGGYGDATITVKEGIYFRDNYCTHCGKITGSYNYGETVRYTKVCITNKYTWISWIGANGAVRWMPIRDMKTGEYWATIV